MKRNYAFELIKFLSAIVIAVLHYNYLLVPQGYLCVEIFFIISGFLLYCKRDSYQKKDLAIIIISKVETVYFYWLILLLIGLMYQLYFGNIKYTLIEWAINIFKSMMFFPYVFGADSNWLPFGQLWFIPVWLIVSTLWIIFFKSDIKHKKRKILLTGLVLIGIVYNANESHAVNLTLEINIGCFSFGMYRGFMDTFIGIVVAMLYEYKSRCFGKLSGFMNICSIIIMFIIIKSEKLGCRGDYVFILLCSIMVYCIGNGSDIISHILTKMGGVLKKLTLLSGPIYYFHYVVILLFDEIGIERSTGKYLFMYIVLCILFAYVGMKVEELARKEIKYLYSINKYNSD